MHESSKEGRGHQVLARISFAQRWLNRAERQCAEGNLTRGLLTLVLAEAEVHQALQGAGSPRRPAWRTLVPHAVMALVAVAAVGSLLAGHLWRGAGVVEAEPAPRIVTLGSKVGTLLDLVHVAPTPPANFAVATKLVPRRAVVPWSNSGHKIASVAPSEAVRRLPMQNLGVSMAPITPHPQLAPVRPAVAQVTLEITAGELIDLVIAAERTLRGEPARH